EKADLRTAMEVVLFCALVSWFGAQAGFYVYFRWFVARGGRDEPFDAWCEGEPIVAAIFCPREDLDRSIALLANRFRVAVVNEEGGYPWPHYLLTVRVEGASSVVAFVRIEGATLHRGRARRARFLDVANDALAASPAGLAEMWLAEDLYGANLE